MRIALVSHTGLYWTPLYARALAAHGHDVRVISLSKDAADGLEVDYVGGGTPSRAKAVGYLARVPGVHRALRRYRPDVVLATYVSSNGLVAALAGARPLVVSAHGSDVLGTPAGARMHSAMLGLTCRRSTIVHAVSEPIADRLVASGADRERIRCFPIGIDVDRFSPRGGERRPGPPRILCTRTHDHVYRNDTIVAALAALRDDQVEFEASFLGGGPLLDAFRAQVSALGLGDRVAVRGRVAPDEVLEALRDADVYVSASSRDGASSALLEALACGVFPVVSDIPANTDWVRDGDSGILFPAGSVDELTAALARALSSGDLRAEARSANRAQVERDGNIDVNMARMERLLSEALERR